MQRHRENYNDAVEILDSNPTETSHEGIKRESVFNELTYFHVTSGLLNIEVWAANMSLDDAI